MVYWKKKTIFLISDDIEVRVVQCVIYIRHNNYYVGFRLGSYNTKVETYRQRHLYS